MPRYSYKCSECDSVFEVFHLMSETAEYCKECGVEGAEYLKRVPVQFSITDTKPKKETAKHRVDQFIKDAKSELDSHKQESRKDYEPK